MTGQTAADDDALPGKPPRRLSAVTCFHAQVTGRLVKSSAVLSNGDFWPAAGLERIAGAIHCTANPLARGDATGLRPWSILVRASRFG